MDINELRVNIDKIDNKIIKLFCERMRVSADIARYKTQKNLPAYDPYRERHKLSDILNKTDTDLHEYMDALYTKIFKLSRLYQESIINNAENIE